ncbi:MAG TPA: DUF4185 domain-containing protein [Trueperaceae bacterium]
MRFALTSLLLFSLSAGGAGWAQGSDEICRVAETLPPPESGQPAAEMNALFDLRGPGWTGADSTYSVPLPDGRTVWLFSDTFLGVVDDRGGRNRFSPLVNNTLVVQDGTKLTTLHGGDPTLPASFFPSPTGGKDDWYWVYDGTVESTAGGDKLRVFLLHFSRSGAGQFGFQWRGNALATVSLPDLTLESIVPVTGEGGVSWGAALMETSEHSYVYGTEDLGDDKYMHLARVTRDGLTGSWEFWDGSDWSTDPAASARLLHGVANEYSVTAHDGGYVLVTMDTSTTFSPDLVAYTACDPQGPWENRTLLYRTPESGQGDLITYNAHAHPQLTDERGWVVSYNVNSRTFGDLFLDATIYRPRFIRVPFEEVPNTE